ncbi:hypothetical protein B0H15DRAFT_807809, partial [Mycena belliarum]
AAGGSASPALLLPPHVLRARRRAVNTGSKAEDAAERVSSGTESCTRRGVRASRLKKKRDPKRHKRDAIRGCTPTVHSRAVSALVARGLMRRRPLCPRSGCLDRVYGQARVAGDLQRAASGVRRPAPSTEDAVPPVPGTKQRASGQLRRGDSQGCRARGEKGGRRRGRGERDAGGGGNQSGHMERWPRRSIGARLATMRVARVDAWAYGGRREAGLALMDSARRRAMGAITVGPLAPDEIQVVRSTLVVFVEATRRDEIVGRVRRWHRLRFAGFANGPWRGLGAEAHQRAVEGCRPMDCGGGKQTGGATCTRPELAVIRAGCHSERQTSTDSDFFFCRPHGMGIESK